MTPQQIDQLKKSWSQDPHWDIENTKGFEQHREELLAYRAETQARWQAEAHAALADYADKAGIPDNLALARVLHELSQRIDRLHHDFGLRIDALESHVSVLREREERGR